MKKRLFWAISIACFLWSCEDDNEGVSISEDASSFSEIGSIDLGSTGASEITAFDAKTKRLFVVNNDGSSRIEVVDLSNPMTPSKLQSIDILAYGGGVNSVAVKNGKLAAAVEAVNKQDNGKVVIFDTQTLNLIQQVNVGALPDMVTFSPDGKFILSANEGEPSSDYSNDPEGSVSIISINENYAVTTLGFDKFASNETQLASKGFRKFGPNATLAKDIEPEYITISEDSKTAWVTLQENNAIAKVDITTKNITDIFPLGTKDHNLAGNELDTSDKDGKVELKTWKVKGLYLPDAIASFSVNGTSYIITANEGDAREYDAFVEEKRIKDVSLDATKFPDAATLQLEANAGRLKITGTLGDTDKDGDYDELYTFGTRSFSIWNGTSGSLVVDSKDLEKNVITHQASSYDDGRSDDKGVEPEGITIGMINNKPIAFIGLERADAVLVYDVSNPNSPQFLQIFKTGDAPEGLLFISSSESPNGKSLLVVSSENDGLVKIFQPNSL
ncbi:MAG: choice-of-anchor I family protein [Flammeovirgaceae bacterium]